MFDSESCRTWGKEASDAYIAESTPLGDTIAKIAKKNSLNPNQIQRVIELANSLTHARLFQKEKDKTFTFPLAKLDDVLSKTKGEAVKVAETYVSMPDIKREVDQSKIAGLFSNPEVLDLTKVASKKQLEIYVEKMAEASKELNNALIMADVNAVSYLKDIKTVVKQMLLDNYSFEDLFATMCGAMPEKKSELLTLFTDISKDLQGEGVKLASMSVDPGYISKLLNSQNVKIINGQHPLYMNTTGYFKQIDNSLTYNKATHWLGDKLDKIKAAIKNA
ncbi:MAG: hypothetical protein WCO84_08315 [bacterium]